EVVSDSSDMMFVKLAYDGHLLWTKFYGTEGDEWAASVCASEQNVIAVAGNRVLENGETSPQLLNLDTAGNVTNEFFDSGYAEVNSIAYNPENSSLIIAWDYSSSGTPKTALFNFTIDLVYRCSSLPVSPLTAPLRANSTCAGLNGQMHLCGNMEDTGPGIISMFSFKTGSSCEHTTGLQIGIKELETTGSPLLYPNPAENSILLRWDNTSGIEGVIVLDQSGRRLNVNSFNSANNELSFEVGALEPGFYYMQIQASGNVGFYCYPFIIKR
ncbi:MAG: T9SS type A sorting domain-containing protein, partial [Bacteroidetes bacterium]|nr:T9SS type A sorting domain-containing protein [Bacteroidota bacterium]